MLIFWFLTNFDKTLHDTSVIFVSPCKFHSLWFILWATLLKDLINFHVYIFNSFIDFDEKGYMVLLLYEYYISLGPKWTLTCILWVIWLMVLMKHFFYMSITMCEFHSLSFVKAYITYGYEYISGLFHQVITQCLE